MNKYKKLMSNTIIFGIGTFSSKLLVFLLMPLYTRVLSNEQYGTVDLIVQTANLLLPIASIGITNGIIRYGLDKSIRKKDVFTTGIIAIGIGLTVFLFIAPLMNNITLIQGYMSTIFLFLMMSSFRGLCSQFVRAKHFVRLYAFEGILSTIFTIFFTVLYLIVFQWNIKGYVLAIISADFLSAMFLFLTASLWKYIDFKNLNAKISRSMVLYSLPLIPTTMFWWVTNVSDRFLVAAMVGTDANGLYAVSYKIPTFIVLVSSIFVEAWQMSAVTESSNRNRFFSNVFSCYKSIIFMAASGLILSAQFITKILVSSAFFASWKYVPFLVLATAFSCMVTFLGSVYMLEKKSISSLVTIIIGAVINVGLNILLIPKFGVSGAAFSTFFSYFSVFVIRGINTGKYVKIKWDILNIAGNVALLLLQSVCLIKQIPNVFFIQIVIFFVIIAINILDVLSNISKMVRR